MKKHINILSLMVMLICMTTTFVSCNKDDAPSNDTVQFGVAEAWKKGTFSTRTGENDKTLDPQVTLNNVFVMASPIESSLTVHKFCITPFASASDDVDGYKQFHTKDGGAFGDDIKVEDIAKYIYTAKAFYPEPESTSDDAWFNTNPISAPWEDNAIPAYGSTDYLLSTDNAEHTQDVTITPPHILFTLKHQTALIRFYLGVSQAYLNLRTFKLKSLVIKNSEGAIIGEATITETSGKELTSTSEMLLSFHFNPAADFTADITNTVTVTATYDVYDKGPNGDGQNAQLTRSNCTASNKLTLPISGTSAIQKGYYYDIIVTLAPDFLYVLSDNDNKSDLELR